MAKAGEMGTDNISPIEKIESNQVFATELIQYSKTFVLTLPLLERWWVINTHVLQGVNKERDKLHG